MINLTRIKYKSTINQDTFNFYYYIKYNKLVTRKLILDMIKSKHTYQYKFFYILFILEKRLKNHDTHIKNEQLKRLIKWILDPKNRNYI